MTAQTILFSLMHAKKLLPDHPMGSEIWGGAIYIYAWSQWKRGYYLQLDLDPSQQLIFTSLASYKLMTNESFTGTNCFCWFLIYINLFLAYLVQVYTSHVSMIPRGYEVAHKRGAIPRIKPGRAAGLVYYLHASTYFPLDNVAMTQYCPSKLAICKWDF